MKVFLASRPTPDITTDWRYAASAGRIVTPPLVEKTEMWNRREEKCIFGNHQLTGPYFTEDGRLNGVSEDHVVVLAMTAILQSDLVFAWMDLPDPDVFWALGFAQANEVRTAVGSTAPISYPHVFYKAVDFRAQTNIPAEALLRAVTDAHGANTYGGGSWLRIKSKYVGLCIVCNEPYNVDEDIMWKRLNQTSEGVEPLGKKSITAHVECFMYGAPTDVIPRDLQTTAVELMRKRMKELEKKNERLLETVRDLIESP